MLRAILRTAIVMVCSLVPAVAQQAGQLDKDFPLLPEAREIELARSAGLPPWNQQATVYVLKRGGYVVAGKGTNGFSCMVGRDFPGTAWPVCFDPEGTATILPRYLREAELREKGKSPEEIRRDTADRFLRGEYHAPRRVGIAYMLSKENIVSIGQEATWFPPHLMIYAPHTMRRDEMGIVSQHMPHSPGLLFEGDPHAYLVVVVPEAMPKQEDLRPQTH